MLNSEGPSAFLIEVVEAIFEFLKLRVQEVQVSRPARLANPDPPLIFHELHPTCFIVLSPLPHLRRDYSGFLHNIEQVVARLVQCDALTLTEALASLMSQGCYSFAMISNSLREFLYLLYVGRN